MRSQERALHKLGHRAIKNEITAVQGGPRMAQFALNALTLSNINRFSKFFHCQNQEKICNSIITKDPTKYTSNVSLHYLVKCQCLKSNVKNKTTPVTTHFKEVT